MSASDPSQDPECHPGLLHLPHTPAGHSPPRLHFHLELSNAENCVLGAQAPSCVSDPLSSDRPLDILQGLPTPNNLLKQLHRVTIDGAHRVGLFLALLCPIGPRVHPPPTPPCLGGCKFAVSLGTLRMVCVLRPHSSLKSCGFRHLCLSVGTLFYFIYFIIQKVLISYPFYTY